MSEKVVSCVCKDGPCPSNSKGHMHVSVSCGVHIDIWLLAWSHAEGPEPVLCCMLCLHT